MTPQERDYEAFLSRVLHSTADQVEPVGDGLTKIRARLTEPWLKRQWWLLRSEFAALGWFVVVRCEALIGKARARAGSGTPIGTGHGVRPRRRVPVLTGLTAWVSSRGPGRGSENSRRSPGPVLNWLRPALAVGGAVVLVVVGVFALGGIRDDIAGLGASGSGPNPPGSSSLGGAGGGTTTGGAGRTGRARVGGGYSGTSPGGQPGTRPHGSGASTAPCATPTSSPTSQSPTPAPSTSPTPTPSPSPSPSPTPTPTPTPSGSASPNSFFHSPQQIVHPAGTTALVCGGGPLAPGPVPSGQGMAD